MQGFMCGILVGLCLTMSICTNKIVAALKHQTYDQRALVEYLLENVEDEG